MARLLQKEFIGVVLFPKSFKFLEDSGFFLGTAENLVGIEHHFKNLEPSILDLRKAFCKEDVDLWMLAQDLTLGRNMKLEI